MSVQGTMTGKPLIESDRVEGTTVYNPQGNDVGSIKRLMIEKISGRVAYAVMSFGGFLGMGEEEHAVPWSKLTYDTNLGGYRTDITEQRLRGAPTFTRDSDWDWSDRSRERQLHDYYRAPYYWGRLIVHAWAHPVDASAVSCGSNRLVGRIYEDQGSRREDTRWSWYLWWNGASSTSCATDLAAARARNGAV